MPKTVNDRFAGLARETMTDKEFWSWVQEWYDTEEILNVALDWEDSDKLDTIKEWNKSHPKRKV